MSMHVSGFGKWWQRTWASEVLPPLTLLLLTSLFILSYFNRFAGLRSGDGEFSGGMALLAGRLPYRDYYTAGPPLNQIKSAAELLIFGKLLIVTRAAAVVERLGIALLLYAWLQRNFTKAASVLGSLVTIIVCSGDRSDPLASYNHDAILFAMIAGYAACISIQSERRRKTLCYAALAGAGAGLSALSKQTVGLGTAVTILVVVSLAYLLRQPRHLVLWLPAYLTGLIIPLFAVGFYLFRLGILSAAARMLFVSGPSAKASSPGDFIGRTVFIGWDNIVWVALGVAALLLSGRAVWRGLLHPPSFSDRPVAPRFLLAVLAVGLGILAVSEVLSRLGVSAVWNFSKSAVYYTIIGVTLFGLALVREVLRRKGNERRLWDLLIFISVAWSVAITLSLSWPAFEAMTLPGLGLLIAATVDGTKSRRVVVYVSLAILVCFQIREKLDLPFTFGSQDEPPVRFATAPSSIPALRGMRLPASTVSLLEAVTGVVATTQVHDTIFTYPEMGLFYSLADRQSPTRAGSHNIDVVPDQFAQREAERLLEDPPAILIYARPTEKELAAEERLWRHNLPSGQRDIIAALDHLAAGYVLTGSFVLKAGDDPIRVYRR